MKKQFNHKDTEASESTASKGHEAGKQQYGKQNAEQVGQKSGKEAYGEYNKKSSHEANHYDKDQARADKKNKHAK